MGPDHNLFLVIVGGIGILLGVTMLKTAARLGDPKLAGKYRLRGTMYFVGGCGLVILLLLKLF